ncbi:hypothetical protein [Magnetovibrio blakemorei]|uniref:Uncharacterized protein n=1 Tax=Magnetovibrio blakemorei TaxID=28181 RepID=A0A1E5Q8D5_9PROT|nr:hypothetical protein [Magnetovibrio blakemorei]OEJ67620.1 hypothetical protein BEN30_09375 [Magnetovibrio blakemorei]
MKHTTPAVISQIGQIVINRDEVKMVSPNWSDQRCQDFLDQHADIIIDGYLAHMIDLIKEQNAFGVRS